MQGEGVTLAEAAALLSVSTDTVRRRIKRGELRAEQHATRYGPSWRVLLGVTPDVTPDVTPGVVPTLAGTQGGTPSVHAGGPAAVELVRLVEKLQEENRNLAGQVGYYQAKLQDAEHRLLALEAPREAPAGGSQSRHDARETASPGGAVQESSPAPAAPWWRRVWDALVAR